MEDELIERIRAALNSGKLDFEKCDLGELEKLMKKQQGLIQVYSEDFSVDSQEMHALSFVYPTKEVDDILSEVKTGKVHELEKEYSEHAVKYSDIGAISARFGINRYKASRIYLPNFRETVYFARREFLYWTTVVAGFDDPEDVGDGIYECDWNRGINVYGPLNQKFLKKFFDKNDNQRNSGGK